MVEIIFSTDLSCAKLLKPIWYRAKDGTLYELPYAQSTDFASTPKATWGFPLFLIPTGWWAIPAFFHDAAFRGTLVIIGENGARSLAFPNKDDEQKANELLLEIMQWLKPNANLLESAQMHAIYEGVAIGGWHAWKEDRA